MFLTDEQKDKLEQKLKELIFAWRNDIGLFAHHMFGWEATAQQQELFDAIVKYDRVSCKSGHGTGKSTASAILIFWFLTVFENPQVPATSPTKDQLRDVLWSRLWELYGVMNPFFKQRLRMTATRVQNVFSEQSFSTARTGRKGNPDALQGFHADNLLILGDEASGISDDVFKPIQGALTGSNNKIVLIGNPTRRTGYFHSTFKKDSGWKNITLNGEESPLVSAESIAQWAIESGKDSDDYRIRVLGEFGRQDWNALFNEDDIDYAMLVSTIPPTDPVVWGVDVAREGNDETVIAKRFGNVITEINTYTKRKTTYIRDRVIEHWRNTPDPQKPVAINIDTIGIGAGLYDMLLELRLPVREFIANSKPIQEKRYYNKKAEMYVEFSKLVEGQRIKLPHDEILKEQFMRIKYQYSGNKYLMESKRSAKIESGSSPDRPEAVMMCFVDPIIDDSWQHLDAMVHGGDQYYT